MPDEQGEQAQVKKDGKTIYETGYGSIFFKNFVAGFARALGSIIVYIFLGGLIYYLAITYAIPQLRNILPDSIPFFGFPEGRTISSQQLQEAAELLQGDNQTPPTTPSAQ